MHVYGKRQPKAKVSSDSTAVADNEMSVMLKNITVTASRGVARKTPIAMSDVDRREVENKLGNNELPEMLNHTPGVYATKNSGAYGDSKLNMRGFQSSNVAVMVNGVPVNDMEHGGLYWSNWGGLGEMVRYMQTQRGLGASKVSVPSIGGTVNIVTKTTDSKRGGYATYSVGNDGFNHVSASFSTGLTKSGWNFSMLFGKKWGDGYIQGTDFSDYDYFFAVSKRLGQHHQIALTGFGSPQSHYQRNQYDGLSVEGWQDVKRFMGGKSVYRYNPTYGFGKNGERKSSAFNFYHKPQFSLNHIWLIDDKSSLNTALYMSIGHGYGNSGQGINSAYANSWYGAANGKLRYDFRHADGTFAYDQVQELNEQSDAGSKMVMTQNFNDHIWYGLLSTYTRQLAKGLDFYAGFDVRSYKGTHTAKISDLYNGAYYTDLRYRSSVNPANNAAALDPNWQYEKLSVGDVVFRDYDSHIVQHGVFSQLEYSKDRITVFVSGTLATSRYWRYDRFYYDAAHAKSDTKNFASGSIKGGLNYNIDRYNNVFANVGYISRAPFFSGGVFLMSQSSNEINKDAVNEKAFSFELGYGLRYKWLYVALNAYFTKWMDKTTSKSGYMNNNTELYTMSMTGVNAKHMGVEFDVVARPTPYVTLKGMLSLGNWRWDNNATAYFYNSATQPLANITTGAVASGVGAPDHLKFTLNQDGIHVGGSAQTTAAIGGDVKLLKMLHIGADYTYYARLYADYSLPTYGGGGELTLKEPWRVPAAGQLDLNARYDFNIGSCRASIFGVVKNVLNYEYIQDAFYDGTNNGWKDAYRVFYAFGRTFSVKLKIAF